MRDPEALRVGLRVQTPNGPGVIRARRCGAITMWLALDYWWRESQLGPVEPDDPEPQGLCRACRGAQRSSDAQHCHGDGGLIVAGTSVPCGCWCGPRGRV